MALSTNELIDLYSEAFQQRDELLTRHYGNMLRNLDSGLTETVSVIGWVAPSRIYEYSNGVIFVLKENISEFYPSNPRQTAQVKFVNDRTEVDIACSEDRAKFRSDDSIGPFDRIPSDRIYVIDKVRVHSASL